MKVRKSLALILALILVCTLLPTAATAADGDFIIDEDGILTKYTGPGGDVVIPDGVTIIGMEAFLRCAGLTSVTIPDSVTGIGLGAFGYCYRLTDVVIPDSVTVIGFGAFACCESLTHMAIPGSVTQIWDEAFLGCSSLTGFTVSEDNPKYTSLDGVLFDKDLSTLIQYPANKEGAYAIPESVTGVKSAAFYGCAGLTGVTIPDGVTDIGRRAFEDCPSLTDVTIPDGVTIIEGSVFEGCTGLTRVTIPASVTTLVYGAFRDCPSLTVYGYTGSEVERHCRKYQIPFAPLVVAPGTAREGSLEGENGESVSWSITAQGEVTIDAADLTPEEAILVACYDNDGRFLGVKWLTAQSTAVQIDPTTPKVKLLWLGGEAKPKSTSATVWGD